MVKGEKHFDKTERPYFSTFPSVCVGCCGVFFLLFFYFTPNFHFKCFHVLQWWDTPLVFSQVTYSWSSFFNRSFGFCLKGDISSILTDKPRQDWTLITFPKQRASGTSNFRLNMLYLISPISKRPTARADPVLIMELRGSPWNTVAFVVLKSSVKIKPVLCCLHQTSSWLGSTAEVSPA